MMKIMKKYFFLIDVANWLCGFCWLNCWFCWLTLTLLILLIEFVGLLIEFVDPVDWVCGFVDWICRVYWLNLTLWISIDWFVNFVDWICGFSHFVLNHQILPSQPSHQPWRPAYKRTHRNHVAWSLSVEPSAPAARGPCQAVDLTWPSALQGHWKHWIRGWPFWTRVKLWQAKPHEIHQGRNHRLACRSFEWSSRQWSIYP